MVVDSAFGDNFDSYYAKPQSAPSSTNESLLKSYFDGSASWFTYVLIVVMLFLYCLRSPSGNHMAMPTSTSLSPLLPLPVVMAMFFSPVAPTLLLSL